ncbi:Gfo/Idh/MocA family protein [Dichotomicrobium thermohalophilum]|uniref:Putative dehydrogenase n=1 Tax=Dichotomicrobium thermohalophilum TaxID=933063 RepID=A0A397PH27_9HYPH|nr:Gfo/Idh/MocA family oxidoreductase [Dichotomicrobium thermohalophilum]RIA45434.1 putative dehydrogenase [Dichotomicrobium thermohalophilum]
MADPIRVAVVGAGYFGRFHAKHYAAAPRAKLVAVVDTDEARARTVAAEAGCEYFCDYHSLVGRVDAVSVAAPTPAHFQIARDLMAAGLHVFVEKPLTDSVESASTLAELAESQGRVLQVGHVERYSAAFRALAKRVTRPLYIESYRIAPWRERGVEVDVILDLMIHDIDIVMGLVGSPVTQVEAVGTPVLSGTTDLANARLVFESGCVANITASRVSYKTERRVRVFQPNQYVICDMAEGRIFQYQLRGNPAVEGPAAIASDSVEIPKEDSLANEISEFLDCVATGRRPTVDGRAGCEAVRVAGMINASIGAHHEAALALSEV